MIVLCVSVFVCMCVCVGVRGGVGQQLTSAVPAIVKLMISFSSIFWGWTSSVWSLCIALHANCWRFKPPLNYLQLMDNKSLLIQLPFISISFILSPTKELSSDWDPFIYPPERSTHTHTRTHALPLCAWGSDLLDFLEVAAGI